MEIKFSQKEVADIVRGKVETMLNIGCDCISVERHYEDYVATIGNPKEESEA